MYRAFVVLGAIEDARRDAYSTPKRLRPSRLPYAAEREQAYSRARRGPLEERNSGDPDLLREHFGLVSARTGCVIMNPELDLAAVCLR